MDPSTPVLPPKWHDTQDLLRRITLAVNNILRGKTNNTGSVTLTAGAVSTVLTDIRIGINSVILIQPTTANAANALATTYVGTPGDGTVTITHTNNAQTDRTFSYAVVG